MAESKKQFQKRQGPWTASALLVCRGNTPSIEIGGGGEGGRGGGSGTKSPVLWRAKAISDIGASFVALKVIETKDK